MDKKQKESDGDEDDNPPIIRRRPKTKSDHQSDAERIRRLDDEASISSTDEATPVDAELIAKMGGQPKIKPIQLELLIRNQILYISPSIEDARSHLISQLFEFASCVTTQKRIQHSRYQVTMEAESEYKMTYKNLLNKFINGVKLTEFAFTAIESLLNQAKEFVDIWLNFQSLWDLQPESLYTRLSENLNAWISCLNEMKESRKSFDTQETNRKFGPIIIDYNKVLILI